MTTDIFIGLCLLGASVLFAGGVFVLAIGAKVWSDAAAAGSRARVHKTTADAQEKIDDVALDAATRGLPKTAPWHKPTDDELRDVFRRARVSSNGHVADDETAESTLGEFAEDRNPFDGGMYRE